MQRFYGAAPGPHSRPKPARNPPPQPPMAACAAASLAIGTRYGEQLT